MAGIINLLPDSVANQIAAGEVIQRPASVVKELVENAVDAGAGSITVNVKDAGKTLVQVIDNGKGMSETDARMCWERHATSKITSADDLFSIQTKGFRGEALASIAAIAEVSLRTRTPEDELGTHIQISRSEIELNEPDACPAGSNFSVKNLFFNVPARRKFLKANSTEFRHIINEFNRIAIAHPGIEFNLIHNNSQVLFLPVSNLRQRIINIFGKSLNQSLISLQSETSLVHITGFIGKPEYARKTYGEQYFFVNNRYIRHPFFHKAVVQAYETILPADSIPSYFIFFETDPEKIDINIHPTKTEIKFEDEQAIWQILLAVVKESIGKNNLSPSLDFNTEGVVDIPVLRKDTEISYPRINLTPGFNPFESDEHPVQPHYRRQQEERGANWESLYRPTDGIDQSKPQPSFFDDVLTVNDGPRFMQLKNKFILTPVKSGLMIIDQKRAHERIIYEKSLYNIQKGKPAGQKSLFPETIELNASDMVIFRELEEEMAKIGFDIREFGNNTVIVNGLPEPVKNSGLKAMIEGIIQSFKELGKMPEEDIHDNLAKSVAKSSAIPYGRILDIQEMHELFDQLFACANPNFSPSGKPVLTIFKTEEIEKILKL